MSSRQKSPPAFAHLVNLAEDLTGTFVLWSSDDYFAEKENLVRPDAPVFIADKYTDKGKWMDGWESQRKRSDGHDTCIVRLGTPGTVDGVVFDTTHFRGNAPPTSCSKASSRRIRRRRKICSPAMTGT